MNKASKLGPIYIRGATVHTWQKKTAVLSGKYLYIFAQPKDLSPESYYWVNNSDFKKMEQEQIGHTNAFLV